MAWEGNEFFFSAKFLLLLISSFFFDNLKNLEAGERARIEKTRAEVKEEKNPLEIMNEMKRRVKNTHTKEKRYNDGELVCFMSIFHRVEVSLKQIVNSTLELTILPIFVLSIKEEQVTR